MDEISVGVVVKLKDLNSKPELNAKFAVIENFISATNRYQIRVLNSNIESLLVKLEKLEVVHPRLRPNSEMTTEISLIEYYSSGMMAQPNSLCNFDIIQLPPATGKTEGAIAFPFPCLVRGCPPESTSPRDQYGHYIPKSCIYTAICISLPSNDAVIEIEDIDFRLYESDPPGLFCQKGTIVFRRCRFDSNRKVFGIQIKPVGNGAVVRVIFENCIIESRIICDSGANVDLLYCHIKNRYEGVEAAIKVTNGSHLTINRAHILDCDRGVLGSDKSSTVEIYYTNMSKFTVHAVMLQNGCQAIMKNCHISDAAMEGVQLVNLATLHIEDCTIEKCDMGIMTIAGKIFLSAISCCFKENVHFGLYLSLGTIGDVRLENCELIGNKQGDQIENDGGKKCKVLVDGQDFPTNGYQATRMTSDPEYAKAFCDYMPKSLSMQRALQKAGVDVFKPVCGGCNKPEPANKKFLKCSKCLDVGYCSTICQKQAWPKHKSECKK